MEWRNGSLTAFGLCVAVLVIAACGRPLDTVEASGREPTGEWPSIQAEPPSPRRPGVNLLNELAIRAMGHELAPEEHARYAGLDLDSAVDEIVSDPRTADNAAVTLLQNYRAARELLIPDRLILASKDVDGERIYYLKEPCDKGDTDVVHPWWAFGTTVRVCKSAHRPDKLMDSKTQTYCGSKRALLSECGCGPSLVWCMRDDAQLNEARDSVAREVRRTVAHAVQHDMPLPQIFTMNESVRDLYVEMRYRRSRIVAGERADEVLKGLQTWSTKADGLQPRYEAFPGQQAGLLTTPALLYDVPGVRLRMQLYDEMLWCVVPKSRNVTVDAILALHTANLRTGENWRLLANRPVCNECHARLDYGMQFFAGYSWELHSYDFVSSERERGAGKLFVNGADDLRGEGELTPRKFAQLATAQPEFGKCAVRKVATTVLGGAATDEDEQRIMAAYRRKPTYSSLLREALLAYAEGVLRADPRSEEVPPALERPAAPSNDPAVVPLPSGRLRELVDRHCVTCHDDDDDLSFAGESLPRVVVSRMASAVATADMPQDGTLSDGARTELLSELVAAAVPDPASRLEAWRYYSGRKRALGVHVASTEMAVLEDRARWPRAKRYSPEHHFGRYMDDVLVLPAARLEGPSDVVSQFTPGEALGVDLTALYFCKGNQRNGGESLEACVARVSDLHGLVAEPFTHDARDRLE
jgi:hypothetical protein